MYIGLHVKHPLFLSDFNETWIFSKGFRKIFKYQISWKLVQWGPSCSIGQTNIHDEANIRFSQFFERAQKCPRSRVPSAAQPSYGHFREFSYKFLAFLTIGIENIRYPWPSQLYETFTYSQQFLQGTKGNNDSDVSGLHSTWRTSAGECLTSSSLGSLHYAKWPWYILGFRPIIYKQQKSEKLHKWHSIRTAGPQINFGPIWTWNFP